jgi:DNA invertase Pin-like site-specific DNA recombinase
LCATIAGNIRAQREQSFYIFFAEKCDKVFSEQVSSVADRGRLAAALEYVREGDTFVMTKLDRLAQRWRT